MVDEEKPFLNVCPNCRSDNLEFDIIEPEGEGMKQPISCNDCGYSFTIWSETEWFYLSESGRG